VQSQQNAIGLLNLYTIYKGKVWVLPYLHLKQGWLSGVSNPRVTLRRFVGDRCRQALGSKPLRIKQLQCECLFKPLRQLATLSVAFRRGGLPPFESMLYCDCEKLLVVLYIKSYKLFQDACGTAKLTSLVTTAGGLWMAGYII
jgi:hypothetical protein